MRTVLRYLLLVPLGLLLGATAAIVALLTLALFIPELPQTIGVALVAIANAIGDALWRDDPAGVATIAWKAWQLQIMIFVLPVAVAALLGEFLRIGPAGHGLAGGATAVLATLGAKIAVTGAEGRVLACLFFSGFAGGLVYYAIGGREPARPQPEPPDRARA